MRNIIIILIGTLYLLSCSSDSSTTNGGAEITVNTEYSSNISLGESSNIVITISETDYDNEFQLTYIPTSGTGTLQYGTITVNANDHLTATKDVALNLIYTPETKGVHTLKFTIKDTYSKTKDIDITINASISPISITPTYNSTMYHGASASIDLQLSEADYDSQFRVRAEILSGSGTLKRGSTTLSDNVVESLSPGTYTYTYTPTSTGAHTISYTVTDDYNQTETIEINVTVNAHELVFTGTDFSATDGYVGKALVASITINETAHSDAFSITAVNNNGSGIIKLGDSEVSSNAIMLSAGTYELTYIPTSPGINKFTITATDIYEQEKEIIYYSVANNINLTVNTTWGNSDNYLQSFTDGDYSGAWHTPYTDAGCLVTIDQALDIDINIEYSLYVESFKQTELILGVFPGGNEVVQNTFTQTMTIPAGRTSSEWITVKLFDEGVKIGYTGGRGTSSIMAAGTRLGNGSITRKTTRLYNNGVLLATGTDTIHFTFDGLRTTDR